MNLKAIIPSGMTEITVNGLHQWDYGRKLEIHSNNLPGLIEVHFACAGMTEAVVRPCSVAMGVAIVAIPDRCLEQTTPVTAWVYELDGDSGVTTVKITLTIEPRIRPSTSKEVPEAVADKYTEALGAMNEAIDNISRGNVTTARAIADENGNNIVNTYGTKSMINGSMLNTDIIAKAEELMGAGNTSEVYQFYLGGTGYEGGTYKNLPTPDCVYARATIFTRFNSALIWLWNYTNNAMYYKRFVNSSWGDWVEMIDSRNITNYTYSIKTVISDIRYDTEYFIGEIPEALQNSAWLDNISNITARLYYEDWDLDAEVTSSLGETTNKQNYRLIGQNWVLTRTEDSWRHDSRDLYIINVSLRRAGSSVYMKLTSAHWANKDGEGKNLLVLAANNSFVFTVRIDFHQVQNFEQFGGGIL